MLKRLKTLLLLQLGGKTRISKYANKKKFALNIFLLTLLGAVIGAVCYLVLDVVKNKLFLPVNMAMLTFILLVLGLISIIACTNSLSHSLYASKDNAILLSYPAKPNEVFLSKLLVAYIGELKRNVFFLLPLLIAFGLVVKAGFLFFFLSIIFFFILSLLPVLIGALISIPLMFIKRLLGKIPFAYVVLFIAFIVVVFVLLNNVISALPRPLRLVTIYNKFVNVVTQFINKANAYALFYTFFSSALYRVGVWLNLLFISLLLVGLVILVYYISIPFYFKLVSKASENASKKLRKPKNTKRKSVFASYLKKELLFTVRNSNTVLTNYILIFFMPIILFVLNFICSAILTSTLGDSIVVALNIIIGGMLVLCSNTQSASAISVEGSEVVLLKTAPSNTRSMVWAKLFSNICISVILLLINSILLSSINAVNTAVVWKVFIVLLFIDLGHIFWSFQLDLVNPKLRDYAESGNLDSNANVKQSMNLALIISIVLGLVSLFFLQDNIETAWPKIILIAGAFLIVRIYFFVTNLKVYFKRIEY